LDRAEKCETACVTNAHRNLTKLIAFCLEACTSISVNRKWRLLSWIVAKYVNDTIQQSLYKNFSPIYGLTNYSFEIYFTIIFPPMPISPKLYFALRFPDTGDCGCLGSQVCYDPSNIAPNLFTPVIFFNSFFISFIGRFLVLCFSFFISS
jgi:hypothetical protein